MSLPDMQKMDESFYDNFKIVTNIYNEVPPPEKKIDEAPKMEIKPLGVTDERAAKMSGSKTIDEWLN
jgi:hypothetical protein